MSRPPFKPAVLFCDVDGCLTSESSSPFDMKVFGQLIDLFRDSRREGLPRVVLCTGRPQPYVECLLKLFDIREPAICENGAVIYDLDGNRARYSSVVTAEMVTSLRVLRAHVEDCLLPGHPRALLQFGKEAQISVYSEVHDDLLELHRRVEDFVSTNDIAPLDINTSHYYLNISPRGVSKGAAISELLRKMGITRSESAGIGDTEGDLSIRDATAWFACPSNARPAIRNVADYTSPYPEARGVLDILSQLVPL
ncbi:MAG: HAD family phosphatase [Candidatus Sumerlaeia bacterium]|nr:HAD family phosphatase [Candidatus Sumerlaeia bacterium]